MGSLLQSTVLAGISIIKSKITGKTFPLYVCFHVTKYCNLKCKYCYSELDSLKDIKELSTKEILDLIDTFSKHGTRFIRLLGGEPLLRKDIGELVDYCKKKNIIIEISTNGYFVKDKVNELKNVSFLSISIDGDRESNDEIRGKGSYDKIIEAIEAAKEHNISIRLHGVISKCNIDKWRHLSDLAKKYNVPFNFSVIALTDDVIKNRDGNSIAVSPQQIKSFFNDLKNEKDKGSPLFNSDTYLNHLVNWPVLDSLYIYKKDISKYDTSNVIKCLAGQYHCWVDCDGRVYACPKLWKKGLNIKEVGFNKAWEYLKDLSPCYSCQGNGDMDLYSVISLNPKSILNISKSFFKKIVNVLG